MKIVLLDASTLGDMPSLNRFNSLGDFISYEKTSSEQTLDRIKEAEIILTNKVVINKHMISQCKSLRYIGILATGTNNIDLNAATNRGIIVQNVAGYSTDSVAQHTFSLLLSLLHQTSYYHTYVNNGYVNSPIFTHLDKPYTELKGKEFGIIGLGSIGKKVAQIAEIFGARVSYYSTSGKNNDAPYPQKSLQVLLKSSDIVSIHAPLNANTKYLVAEKELSWMKPNAILLNTGRGGIIKEADLAKAIDNKVIMGAGIDVFEQEPIDSNNPLLSMKNKNKLIMSPHIAWASLESRTTLLDLTYEYLNNFLKKES